MALTGSLPGYARLRGHGIRGLVVETSRKGLESILANETLYDYAARQPGAREFKGRVPAYAITLPDGGADVVVRHSMRGGALARTGIGAEPSKRPGITSTLSTSFITGSLVK